MNNPMKLKNLKVAILEHATGATLMADFNNLTAGVAITLSGTFAAGWVAEKDLIDVLVDGDRLYLYYTE